MSADMIAGTVLKRWIAVKIGRRIHLIGVLLGGHSRLPSGHWIITSPLANFDRTTLVAVTASSGRTYQLLDRLEAPLPVEVTELLANALSTWRLPADTVTEFVEL